LKSGAFTKTLDGFEMRFSIRSSDRKAVFRIGDPSVDDSTLGE